MSQTQDSAAVEAPEKLLAFRQQQQASIKQQLVNVYVSFFIPTLSPVMGTDWNCLMVLSVLRILLIKGVSGSDMVFIGTPISQPIAVAICCAFASMRDKCRFSAPR